MKKTYIQPSLLIVNLKGTANLLNGSQVGIGNNDAQTSNGSYTGALGKSGSFWDDSEPSEDY